MKYAITVFLGVIGIFLMFPVGFLMAIQNPHVGNYCPSCHLVEPAASPEGTMDYHFLAEDIDPTCMICHGEECCTIGLKHQTHPSSVNEWDVEKFTAPDQIPLQDGYITCVTCHFWRRDLNPEPQGYKLVRLVAISDEKIDWTTLCLDCHKGY